MVVRRPARRSELLGALKLCGAGASRDRGEFGLGRLVPDHVTSTKQARREQGAQQQARDQRPAATKREDAGRGPGLG
jgi:hypothetical protein